MPIPGAQNATFLEIAEACKPTLKVITTKPIATVEVAKDDATLMGWSASTSFVNGEEKTLNKGDTVIYDFGGHRAGTFEFDVVAVQTGIEPPDAPARLKIVYGEVLNDVAESFDDYKAWISASWLPDEIINVDWMPAHIHRTRRHAFRYVAVTAISTSLRFGVRIQNPLAHALTSAPLEDPPALTFKNARIAIKEEDKEMLRKIDTASLLTLRNCMQTVYEDGPRRDMRLWIGDLRLQALASYATFKDYDLAKRCLYLFAAMPFNDEGLLGACLYEYPIPHFGGNSIIDYAMLYSAALLDYVKATNDLKVGHDLFAISLKQFEFFFPFLTNDLAYDVPVGRSMEDGGAGWHFIDWEPTLQKESPEHAVMIYCLKALLELSEILGMPTPTVPFAPRNATVPISEIIDSLTAAHRKHYYSAEDGLYYSGAGEKRQTSWAACAWAVIAGVPESKEEAAKTMRAVYESKVAVKGMTPYLHHYLCEAFVIAGLEELALKHILEYWGSMITAGASTFFEAWDPANPRVSPYGDLHSNSFCHAWSCTPTLLMRQMGFE